MFLYSSIHATFRIRNLSSVGFWGALLTLPLLLTLPAAAWDEEGHCTITALAIEKMPDNLPSWVRESGIRDRLIYLSTEPDRWRGQRSDVLEHINNPDHYLDLEMLEPAGLSIDTLTSFRREFTDLLAAARIQHPDRFPSEDRGRDKAYTKLVPGTLPYRVAELHSLIAASWTTLKTYEQYRDYVTDDMIRNARENVVFYMGLVSHFVGDGCQPLHVTKHHHGWVGDNPKGYATNKGFHSLLDGGLIERFGISAATLRERALPARKVSSRDCFRDFCAYLKETHAQVEPLYVLDKSGELKKNAGKQFLEERLLVGGSMLAGVWASAYEAANIDDFRVNRLKAKGKISDQRKAPAATTQPSAAEESDGPSGITSQPAKSSTGSSGQSKRSHAGN